MDDKLKHRLVGATVILAIMAFFLPLILDSEKYRSSIVSQIPPIPESTNYSSSNATPSENDQAEQEQDTGTLVIDLNSPSPEAVSKNNDTASEPIAIVEASDSNKSVVFVEKSNSESKKQAEEVSASKQAPKPEVEPLIENTEEEVASEVKAELAPAQSSNQFQEQAWVIQIGTFSSKDNATKLVARLRNSDYRAYQRVDEQYSRVYVGPYPDKKAASDRQKGLEQLVSAKVKLIEFDPKAH